MRIGIVVQSFQDNTHGENWWTSRSNNISERTIIRIGSLQESLIVSISPVFLETDNLSLHYGRCKIYRLYIGTYKFMFFVIVVYRSA